MPEIVGAISNYPTAGSLTGREVVVLDQSQGAPLPASGMVVGTAYRVVSIGDTDWVAAGAGSSAVVGTAFVCESPAAGTGTVELFDTRKTTIGDIKKVARYEHEQLLPSDTWIINHNLGYYPAVVPLNSGRVQIVARVEHPSINQSLVFVKPPIAGFASLS